MYLSATLPCHSTLERGSTVDAFATFAKIGVRTALNFVFSLLKRAWRKGEDMELCSEVLQEALALLEPLPPASLFHSQGLSSVWLDAVDKVTNFLAAISSGRWATLAHTRGHAHAHIHSHLAPPCLREGPQQNIPVGDSRLALSLLLELALQRGTLSAMLCAVLLLLELANRPPERTARSLKEDQGVGPYEEGEGEENNEQVKDNELFGAALNEVAVVPFLQRLASVEAEGGTVLLTEKKGDPAKVWRACVSIRSHCQVV